MLNYHILVVAIDHPNVPVLLQQLEDTLQPQDKVTFVFDGIVHEEAFEKWSKKKFKNWKLIKEQRHGCWGQVLRDIYKPKLDGDYIVNFDNDDLFVDNWRIESEKQIIGSRLPDIAVFNFVDERTDIIRRFPINCNCIVKNTPEYMSMSHGRYYSSDRKLYEEIIKKAEDRILHSDFILSIKK